MKLNEEELTIIPATPQYAKDHMDIYRNVYNSLANRKTIVVFDVDLLNNRLIF